MPASVSPMMARRWKQRYPVGVSTIRDMSGPRESVRSKQGRISSGVSVLREKPMMEHIESTSKNKKRSYILIF